MDITIQFDNKQFTVNAIQDLPVLAIPKKPDVIQVIVDGVKIPVYEFNGKYISEIQLDYYLSIELDLPRVFLKTYRSMIPSMGVLK